MKKIWITKYALTEGIVPGELLGKYRIADDFGEITHQYLCRNDDGDSFFLNEDDFHYSYGEAKTKAEGMRDAEIRCLEAKIRQLRDLKF